jgi:hypothetical protein
MGKIGNNQGGDLAIGNNREPDYREKSGVIGSVESQFLESQLFCKFSAKCQIPNFLRSFPALYFYWNTQIWITHRTGNQEIFKEKIEFCTGSFAILTLVFPLQDKTSMVAATSDTSVLGIKKQAVNKHYTYCIWMNLQRHVICLFTSF